jgi:hypothetical protein
LRPGVVGSSPIVSAVVISLEIGDSPDLRLWVRAESFGWGRWGLWWAGPLLRAVTGFARCSTSAGLPDRAAGGALAQVLAGVPPEVPAVRIARQSLVEGFAT